jgi:predicted DNA-binding transcriptional regulator YafY
MSKRAKTEIRPLFERLRREATLLRHGLPFTAGELATEFECSRKTVVRDLEFLRDRMGWDFYWDPVEQRYVVYSAPTPVL